MEVLLLLVLVVDVLQSLEHQAVQQLHLKDTDTGHVTPSPAPRGGHVTLSPAPGGSRDSCSPSCCRCRLNPG